MLEKLQKAQRAAAADNIPESQLVTNEKASQFAKFSFAKQYAEGIKQAGEITPEMREETKGKWVKDQQGTDPTALWASLQNKGTAWCTKGFGTAETQLKGGDFYTYYTLDKQGKPAIPRIAISMDGDMIGEVRGVADKDQNLEGNMTVIAEEKMKELPGAERYKKASSDMKALTVIEKKTSKGEILTKDDLVFLYEINKPIEGFGYQRDPRIKELRDQRNTEEDMPIVFECDNEQIARGINEIKEGTKAYVGPLVPGIFDKIQEHGIEHIYTSFPEGRIRNLEIVEIGGKDAETLIKEMREKKINPSNNAEDMMKSKDFTTQENPERETIIRLKVGDLGFPKGKHPTTDEIYKRIEELGLELCPAETGPHYRLKYADQPMGEYFRIGMKQIADRLGNQSVFHMGRDGDGLWLHGVWTEPSDEWNPGDGFAFRLRKLKNSKS